MSRLDSVIRRLQAQRLCLDWAINQIAELPGVIFELGLGNGRTFDHLRFYLPQHDIYVFDRQLAAHPDCIPDDRHLYLGDLHQTLAQAANDHLGGCILVHCDIGSGVEAQTNELTAMIAAELPPALAPGALVVSDQPLPLENSEALPLPESVPQGRYFIRKYQS